MQVPLEIQLTLYGEIYRITNRMTGEGYVGQTKCMKRINGRTQYSGYENRFLQHLGNAIDPERQNDCPKLYEAIRKYGKEMFYVELLERCLMDQMNERERYYIKTLGTRKNGYNVTRGGQYKRKPRRRYRRKIEQCCLCIVRLRCEST